MIRLPTEIVKVVLIHPVQLIWVAIGKAGIKYFISSLHFKWLGSQLLTSSE